MDYVYDEYFAWHHAYNTLQWRHNEGDGISNHQRLDGLLKCLFRHRSKKTIKLCVTGLCEGNSPVTGEFPSQRASNVENVSIWWRHHENYCITRQPHAYIHTCIYIYTYSIGQLLSQQNILQSQDTKLLGSSNSMMSSDNANNFGWIIAFQIFANCCIRCHPQETVHAFIWYGIDVFYCNSKLDSIVPPDALIRDCSMHVPIQWETTLHCNVVSHWLGTYTKWSLLGALEVSGHLLLQFCLS